MRKIAALLILLSLPFFLVPQKTLAETGCRGVQSGINETVKDGATSHKIVMNFGHYPLDQDYTFKVGGGWDATSVTFKPNRNGTYNHSSGDNTVTVENGIVTWTIKKEDLLEGDSETVKVELDQSNQHLCDVGTYTTAKYAYNSQEAAATCKLYVYQVRNGEKCYDGSCFTAGGTDIFLEAENITNENGQPFNGWVKVNVGNTAWFDEVSLLGVDIIDMDDNVEISNGKIDSLKLQHGEAREHWVTVFDYYSDEVLCPEVHFDLVEDDCEGICGEKHDLYSQEEQGNADVNFRLCDQIPDDPDNPANPKDKCLDCIFGRTLGKRGIWTAIGCLPIEPQGIIQTLVRLALGLGGGITLLLILAGAFKLSVSQGDPKAAEEAKEQITSAVIGLLFIIFSIVMLRFIGVQILQIPGFGT